VQLLRRTAHWLMKEPELNEESLNATANGDRLVVERQTMGDDPGPATLLTPGGEAIRLELTKAREGVWRAEHTASDLGLYQVANGELKALTHVGPANPREFSDVVSTESLLKPVVTASGGLLQRLVATNGGLSVPRVVPVSGNSSRSGPGWLGLRASRSSVLVGMTRVPLFAGLLGLALLLGGFAAMWAREGR
jgi:hypothetical protein